MADLETQLRCYADAVVEQFAPTGSAPTTWEQAIEPDPPGRRHRGLLVGLAAAAVAALVGGVWVARSDDSRLSTELPAGPSSTTSVPALVEVSGPPRLLPVGEQWVVVEHQGGEVGPVAGSVSADVWAFDSGGRLLILVTQAQSGDDQPLAAAEVVSEANRSIVWWTSDGELFGLEGFDTDEAALRTAAASLTRGPSGWLLPGAGLLVAETGSPQLAGATETVGIAPREPDGAAVDLGRTITQTAMPAPPGELYRVLFEASSLGTVTPATIAGADGYVITGPGAQYALCYTDGYLTTWQTDAADTDLPGLLASLAETTVHDWTAATAGAGSAREDAIAQAAAAIGPVPAGQLPYYVLPAPWTLERVHDPALWTDEQRALAQAEMSGPGGWVSRVQTFNKTATPTGAPVPDVLVAVSESIGEHPVTIDSFGADVTEISFGAYSGVLSESPAGGWLISLRKDLAAGVSVSTTTLGRDELVAFAESLVPRSETASDGFDQLDPEFVPGVDGTIAEPVPSINGSWYATWTLNGANATIDARLSSPELMAFENARIALYMGESLHRLPHGQILAPGLGQVTWYHEESGTRITITTSDPDVDPIGLVDDVTPVSGSAWAELATSHLTPPP